MNEKIDKMKIIIIKGLVMQLYKNESCKSCETCKMCQKGDLSKIR